MPNNVSLETIYTKNIVTNGTQTRHFIIVNRDKDSAFLRKQLAQ